MPDHNITTTYKWRSSSTSPARAKDGKNLTDTRRTFWNLQSSHVPLTVNVCSNVPGYQAPKCFVSNGGPNEFISEFIQYLTKISHKQPRGFCSLPIPTTLLLCAQDHNRCTQPLLHLILWNWLLLEKNCDITCWEFSPSVHSLFAKAKNLFSQNSMTEYEYEVNR